MASQHAVPQYLENHQIGALFEELMAKVVNDMPDDPLIYLARILNLQVEKRDKRKMRGTDGGRSPSPSRLARTAPTGGLDWKTGGDTMAVAKDRGYVRPWQTNSKRLKPKKTDTEAGRKSQTFKKDWDSNKKPSATDFDELFEEGPARRAPGTKAGRPGSPPTKPRAGGRPGTSAWGDGEDEDHVYKNYGYRGPNRGGRQSDDPLAGEFSVSKQRTPPSKQTTTTAPSSGKKKGRDATAQKHKRDLERYVLAQNRKSPDSGFEDEKDLEPDHAIELMEDVEDLRREGVRNAKKSGVSVGSSMRRREVKSQVRVSICARCAKVMGGGEPSEPAPGARFGDFPDSDGETDRRGLKSSVTARSPSAGDFTARGSDDEFESVSQVTGPRRPVWQEADNSALTPRKGKSMLASNMSPSKGLPMYGKAGAPASGKKAGPPTARSVDFRHSDVDTSRDPMAQTWAPAASDFSDTTRTVGPQHKEKPVKDDDADGRSGYSRAGEGWRVQDYDTDSSYYGSPGGNKGQRVHQAY